jgi:hypothetical protein
VSASDLHWTESFGHLWPGNIESLRLIEGIWYGSSAFASGPLLAIKHVRSVSENLLSGEEIVLGKEEGGLRLDLNFLLEGERSEPL